MVPIAMAGAHVRVPVQCRRRVRQHGNGEGGFFRIASRCVRNRAFWAHVVDSPGRAVVIPC